MGRQINPLTNGNNMQKDLEPLLEQLHLEGNYDAEGAIMRFGHGDCHNLTWALHKKFGAKIIAVVGEGSGTPVHSCVLIGDSFTLDAYGINPLNKTIERYNKVAMQSIKESITSKLVDLEWICSLGGDGGEGVDEILLEFEPIAQLLDVRIEECFNPPS